MLVTMMIASTSRNPPKVSWPIDSEDDRLRRNNAENDARMMVEPGPRTSQYTLTFIREGTGRGDYATGIGPEGERAGPIQSTSGPRRLGLLPCGQPVGAD